jgi:DNA polymerase-1
MRMTDGVHDFTPDEADPFEALLKRAEALGANDDIGLEAIAKAAIEAKTSGLRLDKLMRAAGKASGFSLQAIKKVFDAVRAKLDREAQAQKHADPSVAAAEAAARQAALDAEKAAREAEHERLWQSCKELAEDPALMDKLGAVVHRLGVVGEAANVRGAYLVVTSRLSENSALSLLRRGAAAGGKNFLLTHVLALIPEEEVIQLSGLSATALVYFGDDEDAIRHKLIIVVEAAVLAERANGDENPALVLIRSLISEGRIDRLVTVPQRNGPPQTMRIRRNGPVAVMLTSARDNIESEMLTRLLVCDADESPGQSKLVLARRLNQDDTVDAVTAEEIERWRDLQRWLALDKPYRVAIPFEGAIHKAYLALIEKHPEILQQLRIRRDIGGFLGAILASAILHKAQRQIDEQGAIVAALADYRHAWEAFNTGVSALYGTQVRKEIIALVKVAEAMGAQLYDETAQRTRSDDRSDSVEITVAALRQALGVGSYSTASKRLQEALDHNLLKEDHDRPNRGRATPRAFWLLKTSLDLESKQGPNVFPAPGDVKKFLEEGGPWSGDVGAVDAVSASHGNDEAEPTASTASTFHSEDPPSQEIFSKLRPRLVDGVTLVICQTYAEAEACIAEMVADAGGKPVALDLETCPIPSERARLETLTAERTAINAQAIADRKAAKKAGALKPEIDAITAAAEPQLKALDHQLAYAKSAGLDPWRAEARTIQAYGGGARAAVIDLARCGREALGLLQNVSAVIHGSTFDLAFLDRHGVTLGRVHDTQQVARLTLGASKCAFAQTVKHYCKVDLDKTLQTSDWSAPDLTEDQLAYAGRDVVWLWRMAPALFKDLSDQGQAPAYKIQVAAAPAIARMNNAGITLDLSAHAGAMQAFAEAAAAASAAYREACFEIGRPDLAETIPKTAAEIGVFLTTLLTEAELANWLRTKKTGALSTAIPALWQAAHHSPIPPLIELSKSAALRASFGEPLPYRVNPITGRVHPHYTLAGAPTGRSTTSEPNIQGCPRDFRIRALFRAADGYQLQAADFHCMELRAAGLFFDDPALNGVFERGDDPHTITAARAAGKPMEAITKEERSKAKNANFGIIYGIGPASLVWQIWKNYRRRISLADAESLLAMFEGLYPDMIANRRTYAAICQAKGRIIIGPRWREGLGRIVPIGRLPEDQSPTTCAFSYPIQGICSDIAMKAITDLDQRLRDQHVDGRIVGWIHDELIVEAREADAELIEFMLKDTMERAFLEVFPQATLLKLVEVKAGATWGAIKEDAKPEEQPI